MYPPHLMLAQLSDRILRLSRRSENTCAEVEPEAKRGKFEQWRQWHIGYAVRRDGNVGRGVAAPHFRIDAFAPLLAASSADLSFAFCISAADSKLRTSSSMRSG
eukprot:SAG31_NODE_1263_length_9072_cov_9.389390_7_plen_104_part_00